MRISRFYQPSNLFVGQSQTLCDNAASHVRVLRLNIGDKLFLFNGESGEYAGIIELVSKKEVVVKIKEFIAKNTESPLKIHLGQCVSRGEKMDYTIQKAIELGVAEITPLLSERCNVQLSEERWQKKIEHWRAVAISACEQSGRNQVPQIHSPQLLLNWTQVQTDAWKLVLSPKAQHALEISLSPEKISLLIGPEGGLDPLELDFARENGFNEICLGPRVLRTETAGLAAIAILQHQYGDLG